MSTSASAVESTDLPDGHVAVADATEDSASEEAATALVHLQLDAPGGDGGVKIVPYRSEAQLGDITGLIDRELSEPYSVYTYRYFLLSWGHTCFLAMAGDKCVGVIICKIDNHRGVSRGYIGMLTVEKAFRRRRVARRLVDASLREMGKTCPEVVLETECSNVAALKFYARLGFIRDKKLLSYYLSGSDAYRLKVRLWQPDAMEEERA